MRTHRGTRVGAFVVILAALALGCSESDSCDDYVDYVCECHADDPTYDCEALRTAYEDADDSLQDECSIQLADLQDQDDLDGTGCITDTGGGDDSGGTAR